MSILNALDVASMGMAAQAARLNTISSNIANMDTVASNPDAAFKAKLAHFKVVQANGVEGVVLDRVIESEAPARPIFNPSHPMADLAGYVYASNVNREEQVADLISAESSLDLNVKVASSLKTAAVSALQSLNK